MLEARTNLGGGVRKVSKIEIEADRLEEIMARFFVMYPIPANGLDTQAQLMRVRLGMSPGDRFEIAEEMAKGWASSIMNMIREEIK
jgi:hypothetical protein